MKITSLLLTALPKAKLSPEIRSLMKTEPPETVYKLVVGVSLPLFHVSLSLGGAVYPDAFNLAEPYDRKTHVFYLPERPAGRAALRFRLPGRLPLTLKKKTDLTELPLADAEALENEADSGWETEKEETETVADGLTMTVCAIRTKTGAPVIATLLEADPAKTALYIGTPGDGYESRKARATIPDMIAAAEQNGQRVLAAVNADFFDIFGDFHPSGLCVKNGRVVANPASGRPFLGEKTDGTPVIADLSQDPDMIKDLRHAAAGLQRLIKDGKPFDLAPGEPFGFTPHPRTAAGVTKDGRVLLLEVDGRIPAHSNGATLTDLARFLLARGAVEALNLDGGGSSAVYTRNGDGGFDLRTVPADLFRPNDRLIRKDFNAVLVVRRTLTSRPESS